MEQLHSSDSLLEFGQGFCSCICLQSIQCILSCRSALIDTLCLCTCSLRTRGISLTLLAIISGIIMLFVYIFRITKYITLIPSTVLHGFLISVGITIALGQIAWALWLNNPVLNIPTHKEIYLSLYEVYIHISHTNLIAFGTFVWGLSFLILGKIFFLLFQALLFLQS